jgi:peroxiredoxin Q/BCP
LAQLRQDYKQFKARGVEVLAIVNDRLASAQAYFLRHQLPFPGLADETHAVYDQFDVQSRLLSLGQRPGLFIVDQSGVVRYAYLGTQQWETPPNAEVLAQLDALRAEQA